MLQDSFLINITDLLSFGGARALSIRARACANNTLLDRDPPFLPHPIWLCVLAHRPPLPASYMVITSFPGKSPSTPETRPTTLFPLPFVLRPETAEKLSTRKKASLMSVINLTRDPLIPDRSHLFFLHVTIGTRIP